MNEYQTGLQRIVNALDNWSGREPSTSVLTRAIDASRVLLETGVFQVHVHGPDDIEEFSSELEALRAANNINIQGMDFNSDKWDDHSFVLMFATVAPAHDEQQPVADEMEGE